MEMTINSYGNDNKQHGNYNKQPWKLQKIVMVMTINSYGNYHKQQWK